MDDVYQRDILSRYPVPRHRLTVRDYYRLAEVGILGRDERVELLEGQLVDMSPIRPRHAMVSDMLIRLLMTAAGEQAWLRVQNPISLDDYSEPEPDFALVRRPWEGHPHTHPKPRDVLLLIEVSDSSLDYDRGAKRELYARAGIREFWIVDLTTNSVLVHREPKDGAYESVASIGMLGTLDVEALPGVEIAVGRCSCSGFRGFPCEVGAARFGVILNAEDGGEPRRAAEKRIHLALRAWTSFRSA